MQITEKLYCYPWQGSGNNCNTYLYAGEKTILIDPGHIQNELGERCLQRLLVGLEQDGFTPEQLDLLLCTHSHTDHCEAAVYFKEQKEIALAMHKDEEEHMEAIARFYLQMTGRKPQKPKIDLFLQEGELAVGKEDIIQVLHTPGHSPGSLSFYFPAERALITGDVVFYGSIGRTDLPDGDIQILEKSVKKLAAITDVDWLLPGHMQTVKGQQAIQRNYQLIQQMFFY